MVCDPRPERARATVEAMVTAAGSTDRIVAIEGNGFAVAAVSPPADEPSCGPAIHCDSRGVLIWAGEMFLPPSWVACQEPMPPRNIAAIVRQKLITCGPDILGEIDGSFCGAWFNGDNHTWTVFNDRWGLIPLFWWSNNDQLIVSPRARLTWQASETSLQIDPDGVTDLLRTQNMLDDHTLIAGVHWLEPARSLRFDGGRVRVRRYWDFQHRPQTPASYDAVIDSFVDASRATLARMSDCRAPLLEGMSGGLDSRMFLAVCHDLGRVPACYTSGFAYGEDMRFGRQLARAAGASHDALLLDADTICENLRASIINTDGLHGASHLVLSSPIPSYLAGHSGAVLIEGYLHGVLGGSDLPADDDVPADRPAHQHSWALDFLHGGGTPEQINALLAENLAAESLARWQSHVDDSFRLAPIDDPLHRSEYTIITGRSGRNDVLVPSAFRRDVLARHPACDRRMIEWYATTPAPLRRARKVYIDVLAQRFTTFARVPRADSSSGMPLVQSRWLRELCWQRERLYTTWARCRHADVRRYGRDALAARAWAFDACREGGLFDPLLAPDARVLEWLRPTALQVAWRTACQDPRRSVPLFSLLTAETMMRQLECSPSLGNGQPADTNPIEFRRLSVGSLPATVLAEVP
jgi:hypothetical protein